MKVYVVICWSNQFSSEGETEILEVFDSREKAVTYIESIGDLVREYDNWRPVNNSIGFDEFFSISEWEVK